MLFLRFSICACLLLSVSSSSWCLGRAAICDCGIPWISLTSFVKIKHRFTIETDDVRRLGILKSLRNIGYTVATRHNGVFIYLFFFNIFPDIQASQSDSV